MFSLSAPLFSLPLWIVWKRNIEARHLFSCNLSLNYYIDTLYSSSTSSPSLHHLGVKTFKVILVKIFVYLLRKPSEKARTASSTHLSASSSPISVWQAVWLNTGPSIRWIEALLSKTTSNKTWWQQIKSMLNSWCLYGLISPIKSFSGDFNGTVFVKVIKTHALSQQCTVFPTACSAVRTRTGGAGWGVPTPPSSPSGAWPQIRTRRTISTPHKSLPGKKKDT